MLDWGADFRRTVLVGDATLIPPRHHPRKPMTLRLTAAETEALRETARREQRSMQDVARSAIVEYVARRTQRRDAHLAVIVREDAELLRRLREM